MRTRALTFLQPSDGGCHVPQVWLLPNGIAQAPGRMLRVPERSGKWMRRVEGAWLLRIHAQNAHAHAHAQAHTHAHTCTHAPGGPLVRPVRQLLHGPQLFSVHIGGAVADGQRQRGPAVVPAAAAWGWGWWGAGRGVRGWGLQGGFRDNGSKMRGRPSPGA